MPNSEDINNNEEDKDNDAVKDETDFVTKDPIKKYQFKYNESLCMTDKYPEISVKTHTSVNIAPGE